MSVIRSSGCTAARASSTAVGCEAAWVTPIAAMRSSRISSPSGRRLRHHGDELERRQPLADRGHAVGLRAVAGDHDAHLAVAQHVREVVERRRRVRRHRHHAGRERREVQQRPLEARLRDDAQAVAGPEAESQEPMCQLAHADFDL